jgi:hypothetical protein
MVSNPQSIQIDLEFAVLLHLKGFLRENKQTRKKKKNNSSFCFEK